MCFMSLLLRYSQCNPLNFSLAYSGVLLRRNSQQLHSAEADGLSERASSHCGLQGYLMTPNKERKKREGELNGSLKRSGKI